MNDDIKAAFNAMINTAYDRGYEAGLNQVNESNKRYTILDVEKARDEAWECARKILDMGDKETELIFGMKFFDGEKLPIDVFSAQEAMQRIKNYERKQKWSEQAKRGKEHRDRIEKMLEEHHKVEPKYESCKRCKRFDEFKDCHMEGCCGWYYFEPINEDKPKCDTCEFEGSQFNPCNGCVDNDEYVEKLIKKDSNSQFNKIMKSDIDRLVHMNNYLEKYSEDEEWDLETDYGKLSEGKSESKTKYEFIEVLAEYPHPDVCVYHEYKGKPYYSIKYRVNGECFVGFGTYKIEVLSRYIRDYFIQNTSIEEKPRLCDSCPEKEDCDTVNRNLHVLKCSKYESTKKKHICDSCGKREECTMKDFGLVSSCDGYEESLCISCEKQESCNVYDKCGPVVTCTSYKESTDYEEKDCSTCAYGDTHYTSRCALCKHYSKWVPKQSKTSLSKTADDYMNKVFYLKEGDTYSPVGVITAVDISNPKRLKFGVTPFDQIPHNTVKDNKDTSRKNLKELDTMVNRWRRELKER